MTNENQSDERTLTDENLGLELFWQKHKNLIIFAAIAVVVLIIAGIATWVHHETSQAKASRALANARTLEELQNVAKQFAGTRFADVADILAAAKLRDEGRLEESNAAFQAVTTRGLSKHLAQFGLAQNSASQGKDAEAIAIYTQLAESKDAFAAPLAKLFLARELARSGEYTQARSTLQSIIANFPDSLSAQLVPAQLQQLDLVDPAALSANEEQKDTETAKPAETTEPAETAETPKPAETVESTETTEAAE